MFDSRTEQLISSSPKLRSSVEQSLKAVDPQALARELTHAFSEIASIRLCTRNSDQIIDKAAYLVFSRRLHRISNTFEAIVCVGKGTINQSAAFVSGIARQLAYDINPETTGRPRETYLDVNSISSDISAMLLFIAAEAHADAKSSADRLEQIGGSLVRGQLLFLLSCLGRAEFAAITAWSDNVGLPLVEDSTDLVDEAADTLYNDISAGIVVFAKEMLGTIEAGSSEILFQNIQKRSVRHATIDG